MKAESAPRPRPRAFELRMAALVPSTARAGTPRLLPRCAHLRLCAHLYLCLKVYLRLCK